jgi:hypothetical protein
MHSSVEEQSKKDKCLKQYQPNPLFNGQYDAKRIW